MIRKINCKSNNNGAWCNSPKIKRSLFGIGARQCLEFNGKTCPHIEQYPRPKGRPGAGNPKVK